MPLKILQNKKKKISSYKSIAIAAGKGGVGKSTTAVLLALSLKTMGYSVGILDADLYGPSIRCMLPEEEKPIKSQHSIKAAVSCGIKVMTMAYFEEIHAFWRAPMANRMIDQLLSQIEWGPLDFLLIDFPPGTGDIPLTLCQKGGVQAAVMVTTPQKVAQLDVIKGMQLFKRVQVPILGIIENMSYYLATDGLKTPIFGTNGGQELATKSSLPFLGQVALDPLIAQNCDQGWSPTGHYKPFKPIALNFLKEVTCGSHCFC